MAARPILSAPWARKCGAGGDRAGGGSPTPRVRRERRAISDEEGHRALRHSQPYSERALVGGVLQELLPRDPGRIPVALVFGGAVQDPVGIDDPDVAGG